MTRTPDLDSLAFRAALSRGLVSRRAALLGVAGLGVAALSACGSEGTNATDGTATGAASAEDLSDSEKVVNWSNWPEYIDVDDDGNRPSLDAFTAATGATIGDPRFVLTASATARTMRPGSAPT